MISSRSTAAEAVCYSHVPSAFVFNECGTLDIESARGLLRACKGTYKALRVADCILLNEEQG